MEKRVSRVASGDKVNVVGGRHVLLYWGLNASATVEAPALIKGVGNPRAVIARYYKQVEGRWCVPEVGTRLSTEAEARKFLERVVANPGKRARLLALLMATDSAIRDAVGGLIDMFALAERDSLTASRMVISSHARSTARDTFLMSDIAAAEVAVGLIQEVAVEFPGVSRLRHLMVSGCATGAPMFIARFRRPFPDLDTIWAYAQKSPNPRTGSVEHILEWEAQTRIPAVKRLQRRRATGPRAGNVAVWSQRHGFEGPVRRIRDVRASVASLTGAYNRAFLGVCRGNGAAPAAAGA